MMERHIYLYFKLRRKENSLTLSKLAKELYVSISKLSDFENGKLANNEELLIQLLDYYGVDSNEFFENILIGGKTMKEVFNLLIHEFFLLNGDSIQILNGVIQLNDHVRNNKDYVYIYYFKAIYDLIRKKYNTENVRIINEYYNYFDEDELDYFSLLKLNDPIMSYQDKINELVKMNIENDLINRIRLLQLIYIYNNAGLYKDAFELILKEKEYSDLNKLYKRTAYLCLEEAKVLSVEEKYNESNFVHISNLSYCELNQIYDLKSIIFENIGINYFFQNDYIKAITFLDYAEIEKNNYIDYSFHNFIKAYSYFNIENKKISKLIIKSEKKDKDSNLLMWLESILNKNNSVKSKKILLDMLDSYDYNSIIENKIVKQILMSVYEEKKFKNERMKSLS